MPWKISSQIVLAPMALVASLLHGAASGSPQLEQACEKLWIEKSAEHAATPTLLPKVWMATKNECGTTNTYAGRLAIAYLSAGDRKSARSALEAAPSGDSPYAYSVDAAKIQLSVGEILARDKPLSEAEATEIEQRYLRLVEKYPSWPTGFALLGGWQTSLGKHDAAINSMQRAIKGDVYDLSGVYRNLTISFAAENSNDLALASADRAFKLNPSVTSDAYFVYAYANASSALGLFDEAELALNLIAKKRPEVRGDPEYKKATAFNKSQRAKAQ